MAQLVEYLPSLQGPCLIPSATQKPGTHGCNGCTDLRPQHWALGPCAPPSPLSPYFFRSYLLQSGGGDDDTGSEPRTQDTCRLHSTTELEPNTEEGSSSQSKRFLALQIPSPARTRPALSVLVTSSLFSVYNVPTASSRKPL